MSLPGVETGRTRYFFDLCYGEEVIHDEVGVEVSGLDDVRDAFVQIIREVGELHLSELDRWEVRVIGGRGIILAKLRLGELKNLNCDPCWE